MERKVKFGICADVHAATIPYGEERIKTFLEACRKENVDFIIELGDFCNPDAQGAKINPLRDKYLNKDRVVALYNGFEKPAYHVLGNHEFDTCNKETVMKYYGMNGKAYYSFDMGGFHFVVLNNNYYVYEGKEYAYDTGNYYVDAKNKALPYLPQEQLVWLKKDLEKAKNPSILMAHNSLHELSAYGTTFDMPDVLKKNHEDIMQIMTGAPNGVYMCLTGHAHVDEIFRTNHIWQYTINSMSNCWIGTSFPCRGRYTEEIDEVFPSTKHTTPYKDAVYAIIEMDDDGAMVTGTKSEIVGPTPEDLGVYTHKTVGWNKRKFPVRITPEIRSRYITWIK